MQGTGEDVMILTYNFKKDEKPLRDFKQGNDSQPCIFKKTSACCEVDQRGQTEMLKDRSRDCSMK